MGAKLPPQKKKTAAAEYDLIARKIPVRDGTALHTRIYLPVNSPVCGVILRRGPYDKDDTLKVPESDFFANGLALVEQSCRGTGLSDGKFSPWTREADDTIDTMDWICAQKWFSGKIALDGVSYGGWLQWAAAVRAPEKLAAITPAFAPAGLYKTVYEGGAFSLYLYATWGMTMFYSSLTGDNDRIPNWDKIRLADTLPLKELDVAALGEACDFWRDWISNPHFGQYWRKFEIDYSKIAVPAYIITGWYDHFLGGAIENFNMVRESAAAQNARSYTRCVIGPWTHTGLANPEIFGKQNTPNAARADSMKFKSVLLRGGGDPLEGRPAVEYFQMGSNQWKGAAAWPPPDTEERAFYLHSRGCANSVDGNGFLSSEIPDGDDFDTCICDPQQPVPSNGGAWLGGSRLGCVDQSELEKRLDILVYTTSPLEDDLSVAGNVKVMLWAQSSALDTDFCAKLTDVSPGGASYNLCEGIMRARFRKSLETPELLDIGEIFEYEIDCRHTANLFKKGHRIRLEITHSNFPRYDRNPNTGEAFAETSAMRISKQVVYHDAARPSRLILPVIRS